MKGLKPFFPYYGSKWRAALYYPEPVYNTIIEPFAGSACYSLRYPEKDVLLIDANPIIIGIWKFLISATPNDIWADEGPQEYQWLRGFWYNRGTVSPSKSPSAWMRAGKHNSSFWGPEIKHRIMTQLYAIRHWKVNEGFYDNGPNIEATWFIDPPYQHQGKHYPHNNVDYLGLSEWCKEKKGQVIVCEQEGADWLPFKSFREMKSTKGKSKEVVWYGK